MPIVRISGKLVYFAHVPKCAGTAIEVYLENAFGPLAFRNPAFKSVPTRKRWTRSSPQHIACEDLDRLFPEGFFDATFAVVRSPVSRLVSAFRFQRDIEELIAPEMPFAEWLQSVRAGQRRKPWQFDNHTRAMCQIVPQNAQVFRLEEGLDPVLQWLRDLAGDKVTLPDEIKPRNILAKRLELMGKIDRPVQLTAEDRKLVAQFYAEDYERFGYDPLTGDLI